MATSNILEEVLAQFAQAPVGLLLDANAGSVDGNFVLHHIMGTACAEGQEAVFLVSSGSGTRHRAALKRLGYGAHVSSGAITVCDLWDAQWTAAAGPATATSTGGSTATEAVPGLPAVLGGTLAPRTVLSYIESRITAPTAGTSASSSGSSSSGSSSGVRRSSLGGSSTSSGNSGSSGNKLQPLLVVVEDVPSLLERCESVSTCAALCTALCGVATAASASGGPSRTAMPSMPTRRPMRLLIRAVPDADWRITDAVAADGPSCSSFALSLLQSLLLGAHAVLHCVPLPSGYSRDVHGRIVLVRREGDLVAPSVTSSPLPLTGPRGNHSVCSLLYRVGGDGKGKAVGALQFHDEERSAVLGIPPRPTTASSSGSGSRSVRFAGGEELGSTGKSAFSTGSSRAPAAAAAAAAKGSRGTGAGGGEAAWGADSDDEESDDGDGRVRQADPEGEWVEGEEQ